MAKHPKIDEQVSHNTAFLILALGFGLVTAWAVYDEFYSRRPWKQIQADFFKLEERLARDDYESRRTSLKANAEHKTKKAELEKLKGELAGPGRAALEKTKADLETLGFKAMDDEQEYTFAKSEWEEAYYFWTRAKHDGTEQEKQQAAGKLASAKQEMDRREQVFHASAATRDAKAAEVAAFSSRITALTKEIDPLENDVNDAQRKWEEARSRSSQGDLASKIEQLNLEMLDRVDRCQTCHLGVDRPGFEKVEPAFYQTHPLRKTLMRYHPIDKFGCTVCHDGQGRATIIKDGAVFGRVDYPHAPEGHQFHTHYWERPLLNGPDAKAQGWYMESNCQHCHAEEWDLRSVLFCESDADCRDGLTCGVPPGSNKETEPQQNLCLDAETQWPKLVDLAPHLARGKKIIEELGCYGCHTIAGYETKPKPAPDLRRVASKIDPGWMVEWIKNPQEIRPNTRMPNFYPEALHPEDYPPTALLDAEGKPLDWKQRRNEESTAMAGFLLANSAPFDLLRAPPGDRATGQTLFESVGCLGCHSGLDKKIDHKNRATHFDHGPDLSGIGSKTSVDWIYAWLKDPKHYNPTARMPNLRLSNQEAADLAAYLATKRDSRVFAAPANLGDPALVEKGKQLIGERGCFGCHLIGGFENRPGIGAELSEFGAKTVDRLDFGDYVTDHTLHTWDRWTYHKLKHPRVYRYERVDARMPQLDLTDEEIWSVMVVLRGMRGSEFVGPYANRLDAAGKARERGRELVRWYNCYGCHTLDGHQGDILQAYPGDLTSFAPPVLEGEGQKTQPTWLFGFFRNVTRLRPWLDARMPTFGFSDEQATALVGMFSALDGAEYPYRYYGDIRLEGASREVAQRLLVDEFKCVSCHLVGDRKLTPEEAAKAAPNLELARSRLRAEWLVRWLDDPQKLMPGTRMPSFFPEGIDLLEAMLGTPSIAAHFHGLEDVAQGHAKRQQTIELLRDLLMTL